MNTAMTKEMLSALIEVLTNAQRDLDKIVPAEAPEQPTTAEKGVRNSIWLPLENHTTFRNGRFGKFNIAEMDGEVLYCFKDLCRVLDYSSGTGSYYALDKVHLSAPREGTTRRFCMSYVGADDAHKMIRMRRTLKPEERAELEHWLFVFIPAAMGIKNEPAAHKNSLRAV